MRNLTNDELLNIAESVPSYTDNAELVAELARRLDALDRQHYEFETSLAVPLGALMDWVRNECDRQGIELPPEYIEAERVLSNE